MQNYSTELLSLLLQSNTLAFGEFATKSGRLSPFFFNTGKLSSGASLQLLGAALATSAQHFFKTTFTQFYGPAYKGIPLAAATALQMNLLFGRDIGFTYNRKETKDHGEGGLMVGATLNEDSKVLIIEDVLTAGTGLRESLELLKQRSIPVVGALVAIDRQERGQHSQASAKEELQRDYNIPINSLLDLDFIIETLNQRRFLDRIWIDQKMMESIQAYRQVYGPITS